MSDDRIGEYLRSRSDGLPPPDLFGAISESVATRDQAGRSPFAPFIPAAVGLALTAAVIVGAILLTQPNVGPPSESAAPSISTPDPSVVSRPSPTPEASAGVGDITRPGAQVTIPAEDAQGSWGSIAIERLPDAGGLRTIVAVDLDEASPDPSTLYFVNDPEMFYLELSIEYQAEREPDPPHFGAGDWSLAGGGRTVTPMDEKLFAMPLDFGIAALELANDTFFGTLTFEVPRTLEDRELRLVYHPQGLSVPAWTAVLRHPGAAPETFAMTPPTRVSRSEAAAAAGALFATPDTCTNPVAGYTVTYPDDWYTNTAIGTWPACSWFSPTFFEVDDPEVVPDEVAIVISYVPDSGPFGVPSVAIDGASVRVGGIPATRAEYVGVGGGFIPIGSFLYQYRVALDGQEPEEGETGDMLFASSSWALEDDPAEYRLTTTVLDRIMASLVFDR